MANPNPPREHLRPWHSGQSGNPGGYSKGRRIRNALRKLLDEVDGDPELALAIYAKASGRKSLLKDEREEDGRRTPEIAWWRELTDRVDGPVSPGEDDACGAGSDEADEDDSDPGLDNWAIQRVKAIEAKARREAEPGVAGRDPEPGVDVGTPPGDAG